MSDDRWWRGFDSQIVDALSAGTRVLEVGCGDGGLVERLVERGLDAVGVDPRAAERPSGASCASKLLTYQSQIMFDPDFVVEIFVFDRAGDFEQRLATAQGQIDEDAAGEVSGDEA